MFWAGLGIFLLGSGSRRQFQRESDDDTGAFLANFNLLAGTTEVCFPHNDTVADFLKGVPPPDIAAFPRKMGRTLIEARVLEDARLFDQYYLVFVDATGVFVSHTRHCPFCLTQEHDGKIIYYHMVLEAKLVTRGGMAISLATEFIENTDPKATKQDCERTAFPRLAKQLKAAFPRLPICLLMDSAYANQTVFDICEKSGWNWIITFKEGSLPTAFNEFHRLARLAPDNVLETRFDDRYQRFSWVNDLEHEGHRFSAFDCLTYQNRDEHQYFAWITPLPVNQLTVARLGNHGGRCRWKGETDFFVQKHCGYALEHAFCEHPNAMKNYYILLQVAHILVQLSIKGRLHEVFLARIQTLPNFFRRLAESIRNHLIRAASVAEEIVRSIQVRLHLLNSS